MVLPIQLSAFQDRINLTLTFAQSIDAKIAGINGSQLALSGTESMQMTHFLRSTHNAILIGINTAINDDPQLNSRLLTPPAPNPIPVILDSRLRLPTGAKLLQNYASGAGMQPWILSSTLHQNDPLWIARRKALEHAGALVILVDSDQHQHQHIRVPSLLSKLFSLGIRSLMVEGGASVIASFLAAQNQDKAIIDRVIITVAPILVGSKGTSYSLDLDPASPRFVHSHTQQMGKDTVILLDALH